MIATIAKDLLSTRVVVVHPEQRLADAAPALRQVRAQYCAVVDDVSGAFEGLVHLGEVASLSSASSRIFADLAGDTPWRRVADDTPADDILAELSTDREAVFVVLMPDERYRGVVTMESAWGWLVRSQAMRQRWLEKVFEEQRRLADFLEKKIDQRTASLRHALDQFRSSSARLSHDIGGPLRTIKMFIDMLSEGECGTLNDEGRAYVERMLRAATKVETLAADILGRAREADKAAPAPLHAVNLNEVLADALELAEALVRDREAVVVCRSGLHSVRGRYVPLLQIVSNLLANAILYVPAQRRPHLDVWSEADEDAVRLYFKDNGQGIAADKVSAVFQPFFRIDGEQRSGAGLGLSIARDAVREMGGELLLQSSDPNGSVFVVELRLPLVLQV